MPAGGRAYSIYTRMLAIFAVVLAGVEVIVTAYYWDFGAQRLTFEMTISGIITTVVAIPVIVYVTLQYDRLKRLTDLLAHLVTIDQMTGLLNRQSFLERLDALIAAASPTGSAGVFAYIDADHFKLLNDRFGHATGDRVIIMIAAQISEAGREGDLRARLGGEEFALFLSGANLTRAMQVADRLRRDVELAAIKLGVVGMTVSVSIGLAAHRPGLAALTVMQEADQSMYAAKDSGRNAVVTEMRRGRVA